MLWKMLSSLIIAKCGILLNILIPILKLGFLAKFILEKWW